MSLISFEKQDDARIHHDLWEIVGMGMNAYMRTQNQDILNATQEIIEYADRLKQKMNTHDYSPDDARRMRVDEMLKRKL